MSEVLIVYSVILSQPNTEVRIDLTGDYICLEEGQSHFYVRGGYELNGILQFKVPDFQMCS
jgi:hypothetical protein